MFGLFEHFFRVLYMFKPTVQTVHGASYSLPRCSVFRKIKKGQIGQQTRMFRDCLNTANRLMGLSLVYIGVHCTGKKERGKLNTKRGWSETV